jgi:hypothetical protein
MKTESVTQKMNSKIDAAAAEKKPHFFMAQYRKKQPACQPVN